MPTDHVLLDRGIPQVFLFFPTNSAHQFVHAPRAYSRSDIGRLRQPLQARTPRRGHSWLTSSRSLVISSPVGSASKRTTARHSSPFPQSYWKRPPLGEQRPDQKLRIRQHLADPFQLTQRESSVAEFLRGRPEGPSPRRQRMGTSSPVGTGQPGSTTSPGPSRRMSSFHPFSINFLRRNFRFVRRGFGPGSL